MVHIKSQIIKEKAKIYRGRREKRKKKRREIPKRKFKAAHHFMMATSHTYRKGRETERAYSKLECGAEEEEEEEDPMRRRS